MGKHCPFQGFMVVFTQKESKMIVTIYSMGILKEIDNKIEKIKEIVKWQKT